MRRLPDGRRTLKQKPGPRPRKIQESEDFEALIVLHAFSVYAKLRELFRRTSRGDEVSARQLARFALTLTDAKITKVMEPNANGGQVVHLKVHILARVKKNVTTSYEFDDTADALIKKYQSVMRNRGRSGDKCFLKKYSRAFFQATIPRRAATTGYPVIATPKGLLGGRPRCNRRVLSSAGEGVREGEPGWVTAARYGAICQREFDASSRQIASNSEAALLQIGFRIHQVLDRLNLQYPTVIKAETRD